MKVFNNIQLIMDSHIKHWEKLGFTLQIADGRHIVCKTLHVKKSDDGKKQTFLVNAIMDLKSLPKVSGEKILKFPKKENDFLRDVLLHYSNLISVSEVTDVSKTSPYYSKGLIYENEEEKIFLENTKGFEDYGIAIPKFSGSFLIPIHNDPLLDRKEGVAFMAITNSQNDSLCKFRELNRFFERAFSAQGKKLSSLLHTFSSGNKHYDFSEEELSEWIISLRNRATHANISDKFVFSSDLFRDMERFHQMAYDVLFNKTKWHDKSTQRRNLLELKRGVIKGGMFLTQPGPNDEKKYTISSDDEFIHHSDMSEDDLNSKEFKEPENWWLKKYFEKPSYEK